MPVLTSSRPPPRTDFWTRGVYTITLASGRRVDISVYLDTQRKNSEVDSPVQANVSYPAEIVSFPS